MQRRLGGCKRGGRETGSVARSVVASERSLREPTVAIRRAPVVELTSRGDDTLIELITGNVTRCLMLSYMF